MALDHIPKTSSSDPQKSEISADFSKADLSNPFFTHHSDNPGLILVSKPLNGDNYFGWKRAMVQALNSKNKLGFVNGSIKVPSEETVLKAMRFGRDAMIWFIPGSSILAI